MTKRLFCNQLDTIVQKRKRLQDEYDRVYTLYYEHLQKLAAYRVDESKRFLMSQSKRVVDAKHVSFGWRITLDNGVFLHTYDDFLKIYVERDDTWFLVFDTTSGEWQAKTNDLPPDEYAKTKTDMSDVLPEIVHLVTEIFPIWHKALQEMDEESLMTKRVLHWIAKQLPDTAWPDILRDFVIKRI